MAGRVHYDEIECKSALNRVSGMGFRWSLNPYRGCVHGCHYCFARRYHAYYDLNAGNDFTSIIFVKTNVAQVLGAELSRRSWSREVVAVGTATDPYQPIEGKYRLTRGCLEAFARWRSPVSLVTKGSMIVRDSDVLSELGRSSSCTVCFSIVTMDPGATRRIEPGTPPPRQRLRAMERLAEAGVNAGVLLAPVIPGITDTDASLDEVARQAAAHGAGFLSAGVLRLQGGTKEHFLEFLGRERPDLLPEYRRLYPSSYAPRRLQSELEERVAAARERHGIPQVRPMPAAPPDQPRQLRFSLL